MNPPLCVVVYTFNRFELAEITIRSTLDNLRYSGELRVHIADDGSPDPDYVPRLLEIAGGYANVVSVGSTNAMRGGYGKSYNLASQVTHWHSELLLPLEDDWQLLRPLDLDPLVVAMQEQTWISCVRLGYIGFTQRLTGHFFHAAGMTWIELDPDSPEPHVAAGHPRLETRDRQRRVGPWVEGLPAGATEWEWVHRKAARNGVVWPIDLIPPRGDLYAHIGSESLGELVPEGASA